MAQTQISGLAKVQADITCIAQMQVCIAQMLASCQHICLHAHVNLIRLLKQAYLVWT